MIRRLAALGAVLAGLLGIALLLAGPAAAHATVVRSDPTDGSRLKSAPTSVSITFDESVGLGTIGYLHVTDRSGRRVDAGPATHPNGDGTLVVDRLRTGLGDGTYTASFRVISADSHPVAGTIRFGVGTGPLVPGSAGGTGASTATQAVFDVLRWVSFAGFALLGGAWLMLTVWPDGRDDRRGRRIVWAGWTAMALGGTLELLIQGPYAAGAGPLRVFRWALLDATLHTTYGQLHSARLLLLGLLALTLAGSLQVGTQRARREILAGLLGVGLAATFSGAGHPGTTAPNGLSVAVDMLHLLAMAAWVGGLVMLLAAVLPRGEPAELRTVLPVFSSVAFCSVVVLAVTGTYSAWRGIGTLGAIVTTTYGLLVVAKIVLFLGLVGLANLSRRSVRRRTLRPRIAYAMTGAALDDVELDAGWDDDTVEAERLRRSVLVETVIALCVLALSAVLVAEPRGKEALVAQYRNPVLASGPLTDGTRVTVTSDPGTHGNVRLTVDLPRGVTATRVSATATQIEKKIGPIPVPVTRPGASIYDGTAPLTVAGPWQIALVVTTSAFDAVTTAVTIHLH
ncbi:MAG: copper resistance CopC/CopD family protein [Jatrophihabitans sp.]